MHLKTTYTFSYNLVISRLEVTNSFHDYTGLCQESCYILHVQQADNSGKNCNESIGNSNVKNMAILTLKFHFSNSQVFKIISATSIHSEKS